MTKTTRKPAPANTNRVRQIADGLKRMANRTDRERADELLAARSAALQALEKARQAMGTYSLALGGKDAMLALAGLTRQEAQRASMDANGARWTLEKLIEAMGGQVPTPPPCDNDEARAVHDLLEVEGWGKNVA